MKLLSFLILIFIIILSCSGDQDKKPETVTRDKNLHQSLPPEFKEILNLEFGPDNFPAGFQENTG